MFSQVPLPCSTHSQFCFFSQLSRYLSHQGDGKHASSFKSNSRQTWKLLDRALAWEKRGVLLQLIRLPFFLVSSLWEHQVRSPIAAGPHCRPPASGSTCLCSSQLGVWVRPRHLTVQGFLRPTPALSSAPSPAPVRCPPGTRGLWDTVPHGPGGGGTRPAAARTRAAGGGASVLEPGVRGHDGVGPRLLAAPRLPGPNAGAGQERGVAPGGARSGRARDPRLSGQRREVRALSDARSPRVWALPGAKPRAVGGAAGRRQPVRRGPRAGGRGLPGSRAAGPGARPVLAANLALQAGRAGRTGSVGLKSINLGLLCAPWKVPS